MLYILDTDHISLLQHQDSRVVANLRRIALGERAVTVVSLVEQIEGRLASIRRSKTELEAANSFHYLLQTVEFYRSLQIILYNEIAAAKFNELRKQKIRIGTQDLRIATIALVNNAVVVTRNRRDFEQIPGLQVLDWSVSR